MPPPDLFPPDMESLLGGVEEERREQTDTTSDNLKTIQSSEHGGESHALAQHPETILPLRHRAIVRDANKTSPSPEPPAITSSPPPPSLPPPDLGREPHSQNPEEINKVRNIQSSSSSVPAAAISESSNPVESPKKTPPEDTAKMSSSMTPEEDGMRKGDISSELATLFSGEGFIPSVSELQLLLPGVIQDISQGQGQQFPQQVTRLTVSHCLSVIVIHVILITIPSLQIS